MERSCRDHKHCRLLYELIVKHALFKLAINKQCTSTNVKEKKSCKQSILFTYVFSIHIYYKLKLFPLLFIRIVSFTMDSLGNLWFWKKMIEILPLVLFKIHLALQFYRSIYDYQVEEQYVIWCSRIGYILNYLFNFSHCSMCINIYTKKDLV